MIETHGRTHDPVGGHLLGKKLDWAYMNIPGQHSIVVSQHLLDIDTRSGTAAALASFAGACSPTIYRFEARPSTVCKGQTSTLSWAASNRGSITASPPNESPGEVFAEPAWPVLASTYLEPTHAARVGAQLLVFRGPARLSLQAVQTRL